MACFLLFFLPWHHQCHLREIQMKQSLTRLFVPIIGISILSATSFAQSRSSFQTPTALSGVTVIKQNATDFTVGLGVGSTISINGFTDTITDIFGFWALDNNDDLTGTGSAIGNWGFDSNYSGSGGIVGFKTNPNTGITQGGSQSFHFNSLSGTDEGYGVHVRTMNNNTLYVTTNAAAVPEPATFAVLGLGAVALIRRKRKQQ